MSIPPVEAQAGIATSRVGTTVKTNLLRPPSISLHQVAERRDDVILGLFESLFESRALSSRLLRLRRNSEGASDAGENGHALVHRHFGTAVDGLAVIPALYPDVLSLIAARK